jgi:hypothetical protein
MWKLKTLKQKSQFKNKTTHRRKNGAGSTCSGECEFLFDAGTFPFSKNIEHRTSNMERDDAPARGSYHPHSRNDIRCQKIIVPVSPRL